MADFNSLNASRKADRIAIADRLCEIASAAGAEIHRRDEPPNIGFHGAGIALRFDLNGVGAMVDIDNLHGGDHALISWYSTDSKPEGFGRYLTSRFNAAVGDLCKSRPHWKATSCPRDWHSLAMFLEAGLTLAARNEAFESVEDFRKREFDQMAREAGSGNYAEFMEEIG